MKAWPWHRRVLAGGAALAAIASIAPDDSPQAERAHASEVPPALETPAAAPPPPRVEFERLRHAAAKDDADTVAGDAFGAISWYVPPPPPPPPPPRKPPPPPPPTAPPLPFSYLGRYEEDGAKIIVLLKGERMYTVAEGEVIEHTYRVERLGRGQLELTYLPLDIRQTMSTGEGS